jgi:hypothetical protein
MTSTVERPTGTRAAGNRWTGEGGAPVERRPRPPVRVAESVLGGCAFVLVGFVLPVASVPAGLLLVLRRRGHDPQAGAARPRGSSCLGVGVPLEPAEAGAVRLPAPRSGAAHTGSRR